MPHDTHFLERLQRVDQVQAGRALSLYRDPELVKAVIAQANLSDQTERVAIALEPTQRSPHVIVDRAGHFITCLASGMSVGGCPVVGRSQLDGVIARTTRERSARALLDDAREQGPAGLRRLFYPLQHHPGSITNEEILPLLGVAPLLADAFHAEAARCADQFHRYLPSVDVERHSAEALRVETEYLWTLHAQLGTYALLAAEGIHGQSETLIEKVALGQAHLLSFMAIFPCLAPTAARLLWATGRLGRWTLPLVKQAFQALPTPSGATTLGAGLVTIALGHERLKAEISKLLNSDPKPVVVPGSEDVEPAQVELLRALRPIWSMVLNDPERTEQRRRELLQDVERAGGGDPTVGASQEMVPPALTLNLPVGAFDLEGPGHLVLLTSLPWLARARPEELYLAPELAALEPLRFSPAEGVKLVRMASVIERTLVSEPVRAEVKPGRNEPCSCGSGKKYKKCCASVA